MESLEGHLVALARRFALAITLVFLVACDDNPVEPPFSLMLARARWDRANVDSYELTLRRLCECLPVDPVRVTVSAGTVVSRVNVTTGDPVPQNMAELFPDVPGLFAIVTDARANAHDLDVDFDETYGFPTVISIDWARDYVDDEVVYRAEDFEVRPE